ncbi:3-oxoacyl-[acyl-carrier-protein] reductase [Rubrivirga sp. SAORIC476]|uniref:beta-ketoacyl-ACP reductase n=1 Tax=Rubrivirga sp. SAORIC476 TaxID=1961794 RepID=UPI000BA8F059|nr:3-oxoacyl-[acyl-carrier-protein] reductase [Rubrivirga sp. SAORIC476]
MMLDNKVAVITGGAQGIGRATCERFVRDGASVVIADVADEAGAKLAEALGDKAVFVHTDVTDADSASGAMQAAIDHFGGLDIVVNNAGITRDATLKKMTGDQFDAVINVNLKGVYLCTQAAVPHLEARGGGAILNAASVVAHNGNFGQTNYVATKAGVIGMTKTWARELGRKGIRVNAVAPGFIATEMVLTVPEKVLDGLRGKTPLGTLGQPDDIAAAYAFLASDDAAFITGTCLNVDGGLVL